MVLLASTTLASAMFGGCAYRVENRRLQEGQLEGSLDDLPLTEASIGDLVERQALEGFASVGIQQHARDGRVEATIVFEEGLDDIVEGRDPRGETISVVARTRGLGSEEGWRPDHEGRVVGISSHLVRTEEVLSTTVTGDRQLWDIYLDVDFDSVSSSALLVDATDPSDPPPTIEPTDPMDPVDPVVPADRTTAPDPVPVDGENVTIRIRYQRDWVRTRRSSSTNGGSSDYDC
ncbi:MAG: hypothetical protein R3B82_01410 [Sandaracinaceae bacterium]